MKTETLASSESLKYIDKFLMFYEEEGKQYKIYARNQVAYELLMEFYHKEINDMCIKDLIDLIVGLEKVNANPSTRKSFFEKLLLKCLYNSSTEIGIYFQKKPDYYGERIDIKFKSLPEIVKFDKHNLPNIWNRYKNYLYMPEHHSNYPLFDFFLVTKLDYYSEPSLICCRATIQSISDQSKRDMQSDTEKQAAALQWYNFYKENKLGKIIEVYFIPEKKEYP
jgi:hypothetical protein